MTTGQLHPMLASQIRNAKIKIEQIEAVAFHLAELLRDAHGGDYRIQIEDQDFIMIARRMK